MVEVAGAACAAFIAGIFVAAAIYRWRVARAESEAVRAAYLWGDQWKARHDALFGPLVSRVEVIDEHQREYVAYGVRVQHADLQDEGQTLKVFLETRPHLPLIPSLASHVTGRMELSDEQREALRHLPGPDEGED